MVVGIISPGAQAVTVFGVVVISLRGLGGWLSFGEFASNPTRVVGASLVVLALLLVAYLCLFFRASLKVDGDAVVLDIPLYGRTINRDDLVEDGVRAVNLKESADHVPVVRTNGIGLPGFLVGRVRLRDGTKALVALTNRSFGFVLAVF